MRVPWSIDRLALPRRGLMQLVDRLDDRPPGSQRFAGCEQFVGRILTISCAARQMSWSGIRGLGLRQPAAAGVGLWARETAGDRITRARQDARVGALAPRV